MQKLGSAVLGTLLVTSLAVSGMALAQQGRDPHHPEAGDKSVQTAPAPQGGAASGTPTTGTMGPGGMMGQGGMMGPGGMMGEGGMMRMMGRDCPMMGMAMGEGDGTAHAAGRIAFLKAELGITEAQKEAFDAYAAALTKNLEGMQAMRSTMMASMQAKTPVERLSGHLQAMETRLAVLNEVKPALEKLYGALSDEQKKKADQTMTGMGCMM